MAPHARLLHQEDIWALRGAQIAILAEVERFADMGHPVRSSRADVGAYDLHSTEIEFKASPYYVIEQQIGSTVACDGKCLSTSFRLFR